jgi:deoxyribodipyrimidine photo-lyase
LSFAKQYLIIFCYTNTSKKNVLADAFPSICSKMEYTFHTDFKSILSKLDEIDPITYGKTRNYVNGQITYLSPYISRGVISTNQVFKHLLQKGYSVAQMESLIQQLCWRDYFQRVAQVTSISTELKHPQNPISNHEIPEAILTGTTGIKAIDNAIHHLYETGYMHNHCRLYTASLVCNSAQSHWLNPAKWMYFHLLDGDWASNACSWQWVAGTNSNKKYLANQSNINTYTNSNQNNTFLDKTYEELQVATIPSELTQTRTVLLKTSLPKVGPISIETSLPTFVYNYYNLDPTWHLEESGNRILLLEPSFFESYPISEKCLDFMLQLSKNIPNLQVFVGSFNELTTHIHPSTIYFKEHPFNSHYVGIEEPRDWISPEITGYFPSFFAYWKKVKKSTRLHSSIQ